FFFSLIPPTPTSPLFPYTTLFRSQQCCCPQPQHPVRRVLAAADVHIGRAPVEVRRADEFLSQHEASGAKGMPRGVCMNRSTVLPRYALMMTAAVGGLLATAAAAPAQVETKYETYTATAANLSVGSGEALRINVFRWSSDDERQKALSALGEKGDKGLPGALASAPSAGYLWTSETMGYTLRYAYK